MTDNNYQLDDYAWNVARAEVSKILSCSPGVIAETAIRVYLDNVTVGEERIKNNDLYR